MCEGLAVGVNVGRPVSITFGCGYGYGFLEGAIGGYGVGFGYGDTAEVVGVWAIGVGQFSVGACLHADKNNRTIKIDNATLGKYLPRCVWLKLIFTNSILFQLRAVSLKANWIAYQFLAVLRDWILIR